MADEKLFLTDRRDENVVEYFIFPRNADSNCVDLIGEIFIFLTSECSLGKYIWQCEAFNLKEVSKTAMLPAHLYGRTYFGDNIEDEWYVVFMLLQLSKRYEDIAVRVADDDGEFLLIEAAESLPSWLNPSTADNRVFIHRGEVHIVDGDRSTETMAIRDALAFLHSRPQQTRASQKIQRDISRRIEGYPGRASANKHSTNCYIPAKLSALLDDHPSLVSSIVCAFYERDDLDLKHCVTFKHFQPGTRVMRRVQMTRCLYAQLVQQKFNPDPRSGYSLPHVDSKKFKAHDLGAKLAHGAEILCSASLNDSQQKFDSTNQSWSKFHKSLVSSGFFKNEMEGSKHYNELLSTAKCFFISSIAPYLIQDASNAPRQTSDLPSHVSSEPGIIEGHIARQQAGNAMLALLKDVEADLEAMRKEAENLEVSDDDGWMDIGPDELDEKLSKYCKGGWQERANDAVDVLPKKVKSFVGQKSGHLGVELPESGDSEIFFEPNTFMSALQKVFDFDDPNVSSSDSDLDEYASESESDEDEMSLRGKSSAKKGVPSSMKDFMDMMDAELAGTEVGKSFVLKPDEEVTNNANHAAKTSWATWGISNKSSADAKKQTNNSNRGPADSKTKNQPRQTEADKRHSDISVDSEDDGEFKPVDIDMNLVQNLLRSYSAQQGLAGPSSVVLNSLGLKLPAPEDSENSRASFE